MDNLPGVRQLAYIARQPAHYQVQVHDHHITPYESGSHTLALLRRYLCVSPMCAHYHIQVVRKKGVLAHMTILVIKSSFTPNFPVLKITPFLQMSIYLPFLIPSPTIDATRHTFQNFQQFSHFLKVQRQSQLFSKPTLQSKGGLCH